MASIFYEGDLQSGISLALRDSKSVACFITDDGEESSKWEEDYFGDDQIKSALSDRAVTLRIQAGTQEAEFLSAYYPLPVVPMLILICNGVLTLDMRSGRDKATFKSGVLTTLIATPVKSSASSRTTEAAATSPLVVEASASSLSSREQARETPRNPPSPSLLTSSRQMPAVEPSQTETSPSSQNSAAQEDAAASSTASGSSHQSVVQRLLEERRRKLEVDKKNREAAEKAGRKVKAEARKESIEAAPDSAKARQATYAQEQRKRNAEAKLERERILRQIEQDKADRKEKEERRKTLARIEAGEEISEDLDVSERLPYQNKAAQREYRSDFEAPRSKDCAVQVRLFDGSTIRSKFKPEQTITDLRDWVEKERSDDGPFTFKQILSPLPNRSIMISEEKDSLMQLGFVPSATLVMVPIMGYAAAYRDAGPGLMSNLAALPFNVVAAGAGLVPGALRTLLGFGQAVPAQGEPSAQTSFPLRSEPQASTIDSGINVRTLRDQREERDDYQLYNGNQINVEPRNEDIDKDK